MSKYDGVTGINCGSDSMGLTLSCDDLVYYNYVQKKEELAPGRIYIYENKDNRTTIHRLVGCADDDCNTAIFKGDNNRVSELVERKRIIKKVEMIKYG